MTIVIGYDIETTGLLTPDHRLVEVYASKWDLASRSLIGEFATRVNPERTITAEAQRVHGISNADVAGERPWAYHARPFADFMKDGAYGVAHNGWGFDFPFLNQEQRRVGAVPLSHTVIDTMLQGRWATPHGKVPNLGELCFACEVTYDPSLAHAADYDVDRMMECFFKGLDWGWFKLENLWEDAA